MTSLDQNVSIVFVNNIYTVNIKTVCDIKLYINPNKAGLFEGSFSCGGGKGGQFDPPSYFKKNLSNLNETLYNC